MGEPIKEYRIVRKCWGASDIVGNPLPGEMWVYYKAEVPQMVDFLCPCGCGNACPTHLVEPGHAKLPNNRRWQFSIGPNGPTLSPSIRWLSGCKSHFNIENGKVIVHGDSGK